MRRSVALLIAAAALVAAALPSSAPAKLEECPPLEPPERGTCVFIVDDHFTSSDECGFPLRIDAVGRILYTPRRDSEGNLIGESFRPNIRVTLTNPANGRKVFDRDVGLDKATIFPDGSARILSTGIHFKARTDDRRTVFRRIGLQILMFDSEGNFSEEIVGGNFQPFEDFDENVCGYLAGD